MNSIQRRLTLGLGALCCLLWSVGGLTAYLAVRTGLIAEFDQALKSGAQALATLTEQSQGQFKFDSAGELMPAFDRAQHPDYFQLWAPDGSTLARSPSLQNASLPQLSGTLDAPRSWNLTLPDGLPGRAIGIRFVPEEDEDTSAGPPARGARNEVTLVVARHRGDLDHRLHLLGTVLLLVGAAMAAATVIVVTVVVRRGLHPLSGLAERAAAIDASSLQLRFPTGKMPAELLPIGLHLNDLLARLEASFTRERRFSADVAHELRTPIAELRALAEVALKWPDDTAAIQRALKDALAIALQMESIATGLLAVARCEGGLLAVHPERVSIDALLQETFQPFAAEARAKQLAVSMDVAKDACWFSDPVALRRILTNLLSNAVEHSPAAGAIRLRVEESGSCKKLLISNTTDNLTAEDLPHLFERFWQKDAARSSAAHCGLGLALAKAYAQSLGMELSAELTHSAEITFVLFNSIHHS